MQQHEQSSTAITGDVDEARNTIAQQVGESPTQLHARQDVAQILERMTDGIVVTLHISRPRFTTSIISKKGSFGLEKLGLVNSKEAEEVIREYFSLGSHSLLPPDRQKKLANIQSSARACLDRYSFKTHWGSFIPTENYREWKDANEGFQSQFEAEKLDILDHYNDIIDEVLSAYRKLADDAWMQISFGSTVVRNKQEALEADDRFNDLYRQLASGRGKEEFIQTYLSSIREAMPTPEEVADAFLFEVELGYIPLPSLLAREVDEADHIVRERTLRDSKLRAEMEVIEAQKRVELNIIQEQQRLEEAKQRTEWQTLNQQQQVERQATYLKLRIEEEKLQAEREKIERQRAMDNDVIANARKQKDQLVQEFYVEIVGQINKLVLQTCQETLESIDENGGRLRGPVSTRLGNLIKKLRNFNFVGDELIDAQISRLESVLPSDHDKEQARRGIAHIETSAMRATIQQISQEAAQTLIDIGQSPVQRRRRITDDTQDSAIVLDATRQSRQSLQLGNPGTGTRRKSRGSIKL
jgi:hypothetical protein